MSGGQGGKGAGDPVIALLIVMGTLWLLGWGIWKVFEPQLMEGMRWIRMGELAVVNVIQGGKYDKWMEYLWSARGAKSDSRQGGFRVQEAKQVSTFVTDFIKWPFGIVFVVLAYLSLTSIRTEFKGRYTVESFIKVQSKVWKVITPIVNFNPSKSSGRLLGDPVPRDLPLFAEPLAPEEWIAHNRIQVVNGLPEKEAARRAFAAQLGPRWTGPESLPPYLRALFVAFAMKGAQSREESDHLLGEISTCWTSQGGIKLTPELNALIEKTLKDPKIGGRASAIAKQHAYRNMALLGVLRWARKYGGVLAPAQFLWLRGVDRGTWYALNNLGRRTFFAEGAGALAHFMAETSAQKPLTIPRVDTAIITLNQYVATTGVKIPALQDQKPAKT